MENQIGLLLTEEEKEKFITALTAELVMLRTKAEISQEELATLIGISRQSYGAIERKTRKMSWSTFLALIMFYDYNRKTHRLIRSIGAFPYEIIKHFNHGSQPQNIAISSLLDDNMHWLLDSLDAQALHSIRTLIMVEYARCTNTPGNVVVKSFDGQIFLPHRPEHSTSKALKSIKERRNKNDATGNPKES